MKCLSVKQPWAWCLFHGKPVENRTWTTKYRGPLLIHASKTWDREGDLWIRETFPGLLPMFLAPKERVLGVILGRVDLVDVVTEMDSPWFFGTFGFVLENPVEFRTPIPWTGALGLFDVPDHVMPGWKHGSAST